MQTSVQTQLEAIDLTRIDGLVKVACGGQLILHMHMLRNNSVVNIIDWRKDYIVCIFNLNSAYTLQYIHSGHKSSGSPP